MVREKCTIRSRFDCLVGKLAVQGRGHKFNSQHWVKLSKCVSNDLAVPELWRQTQADPWWLLSVWFVPPFLEKWEILSKAKQADKKQNKHMNKNPNKPNYHNKNKMKQKTSKSMGAVLGMAAKAVFWLPSAHMCMCTDSVRHVYLQYTIMHTPPRTFSNGNHKTVQSATQNACPESVLAVRRDSIPCCIWTRWKQKLRERIPSLCTPGRRSDAVQIIIRWFVSR